MPGSRRFRLPDADQLSDIDQVAELLGITRQAAYQRRYRGDFPPAIKVGSSLRWRRADIEAWLDQNSEGRR